MLIHNVLDGKVYNLAPFDDEFKPLKEFKLFHDLVVVDLNDGSGFILELNNFLDFNDAMDDWILVPIQACLNVVTIDDVPKKLCPHKMSTQSVHFSEENLRLPIFYKSIIPFFMARYTSDLDIEMYKWV